MKTTTTETPLLTIHVEGKPCSVNRMYKPGRRGGKYLAPEAKSWEEAVWAAATFDVYGYMVTHRNVPIHPALRVVCTFYGVRGDADNYLKTTLDGLKLAIHVDDRYYTTVEARKSSDRTQPQGALIEVYAATPQQAA